ncbi:MAG: site-specific recombinase XerD [Phycisphaerales bacterium]|nr:site-specific recombinase XerD [Phycisphaerales bacterium]
MSADPFANVRRINERHGVKKRARRPLSDEQAASLLRAVPADRRIKYAFGLYAGLRRSELADLRWSDLRLNELPHPFIQLRQEQTKNGKADVLPLHPYLVTLLEDIVQGDPSERVVSSVPDMKTMAVDLVRAGVAEFTTDPNEGVAVKGEKNGKRWVKLTDGSGRRIDFHALRHTFATNLDRVGGSTTTRKAFLRHADEGVTERYTHARLIELFNAIRQLPHPQISELQDESANQARTAADNVLCIDQPVDHPVDQTLVGQGQPVAAIGKKKHGHDGSCLTRQPRYTPALVDQKQPRAAFGGQDIEAAEKAALWPSTQVD